MHTQVFDFHHQKFCPGSFNEKEALYAAMATWPKGVRPVVHWSESQEGRIPHAHSDYISVRPLIYPVVHVHPLLPGACVPQGLEGESQKDCISHATLIVLLGGARSAHQYSRNVCWLI